MVQARRTGHGHGVEGGCLWPHVVPGICAPEGTCVHCPNTRSPLLLLPLLQSDHERAALIDHDVGCMIFVPLLTTASSSSSSSVAGAQVPAFKARVRYRAQGTVPSERYGRPKLSWKQAESLSLIRSFLAAHGVLPNASPSTRR